jgi:hypothetical protein
MLLGWATPQSSACGARKKEEMYADPCPNDDAVPHALGCGPPGCFPASPEVAFPRARARVEATSLSLRHAQAPGTAGKQRDLSQ